MPAPWAVRWTRKAHHFAGLLRRVMDQAERRVLHGERVPATEKIVSLFESHTDIVRKGGRDNLAQAKALGVQHVVFHKKSGLKPADTVTVPKARYQARNARRNQLGQRSMARGLVRPYPPATRRGR